MAPAQAHALLALCLAGLAGIMLAMNVYAKRRAAEGSAHLLRRWRRAAVRAFSVAAASSAVVAVLALASGADTGLSVASFHAAAALAAGMLLASMLTWQDSQVRQLWQPALLSLAAAGMDVWGLAAAALDLPHDKGSSARSGGSSAGWLAAQLPVAHIAVLGLGAACDFVASVCLAIACLKVRRLEGEGWQPLLADERGPGTQHAHKRWRLAYGVAKYVWPDTLGLQLRLLGCFGLLGLARVVNILVPLAYKHVVDRLSQATIAAAASGQGPAGMLRALCGLDSEQASFWDVFWPWVAAWLALFFLQGGSSSKGLGLLSNVRDLLTIPVAQRAYKRISLDVFAHLLRLDHSWHLHRNTGKVMRVLDRGTSSCQDVMQVFLFNVLPQVIDVLVACAYMALRLEPWTAAIVLATVLTFVPLTLAITEWRGKVRKKMNKMDDEKEGRAADMLINYETVKLFTAEEQELSRYGASIDAYQAQEKLQLAAISWLNLVQGGVVFMGMASGLVVCVKAIVAGRRTVGDAILFLTLMNQLLAPLSFFGSYYRQIQKGLIDCETMFALLDKKPLVHDAPEAGALRLREGMLQFDNVTFSYSPKLPPVLRNISFSLHGGRTLGLVGATGSGKSSVLRLLLRFWDPQEGRVLLDGQDIAACTLRSVRGQMAVVPQDALLFNETILYNIRYGRPEARPEEVEEAASVAQIHEAILRFPAGYDTLVGERGLRLSGGEKQRVAIARAVLRRPRVLVLDEATSALDSMTERSMQAALADLRSSAGCTTVVVAHRLSTLIDADQILVLQSGQVVESGSFAGLLQQGGLFAEMWQRQQETGGAGGWSSGSAGSGSGSDGGAMEGESEAERQHRAAAQAEDNGPPGEASELIEGALNESRSEAYSDEE